MKAALKDVWYAGNEACAELLHPMIGEYRQNTMNAHQDDKMSLFYKQFLVRFRDVMSIYGLL